MLITRRRWWGVPCGEMYDPLGATTEWAAGMDVTGGGGAGGGEGLAGTPFLPGSPCGPRQRRAENFEA